MISLTWREDLEKLGPLLSLGELTMILGYSTSHRLCFLDCKKFGALKISRKIFFEKSFVTAILEMEDKK